MTCLQPPKCGERSFTRFNDNWICHKDPEKPIRNYMLACDDICQPDGRPPQPARPWKSGRVHFAEGSNVVVLELPYSTEFGRDSRKFASGFRKYGKFSHFLTHLVVYGGQGENKYYLL